MSQGLTGTVPQDSPIRFADTSSIDAFSRLRVSNIVSLWAAQFTYNLQPILLEPLVTGAGASVAHDATERCALMTFSATTTGGQAYIQSYEHIRYQPGKSQLIVMSFNFVEGVADCLKFVGYSDGTNGIELQLNGTALQVAVLSGTSLGNQTIAQASWNLDPLDGSGPSKLTLDVSKTQILILDFQALYSGRVRIGFDIGGVIIYAHEFDHANISAYPYLQSANLPVRVGMTCTGTVTTTMNSICNSVSYEGGDIQSAANSFVATNNVTAASGARTHMLSIRPKTTFNSITNRTKFILTDLELLVTGTSPIQWELCVGQALTTPSYADINATYSAFEKDIAGTLSGSPAVVLASGYVAASNQVQGTLSRDITAQYPITLDAAGAVRDLGTLTLLVTGIGGASACRAVVQFQEAN